jgi:HK97 family phage major capsid protein
MPDVTSEDFKKYNDQVVVAVKALEALQTKHSEVDGKIIGLDEAVVKAQNGLTEAMSSMQKMEEKYKAQLDEQKAHIEHFKKQLARGADGLAEQADFADAKAYHNQMNRFLKRQIPIDAELVEKMAQALTEKTIVCDEPEKFQSYKKDMVEGSNPTGGYWVLPERSQKVITREFETSPWRLVASVISTSSNQVDMIIDDNEADATETNEVNTQAKTATAQIGILSIPVNEIYVAQYATQWMLEDAGFDLAAWLNNKGVSRIQRKQNTAFTSGSGAGAATGYLTLPDNAVNSSQSYVRGQIYTRTTAGSLAIAADDLKLMQNDLKEVYQSNAVWMMKRATFGRISILKDSAGQYIFNNFYLQDKPQMNLLGRRIIFADDLGGATTAGAYPIIYGDFGVGYTIVDRLGNRFLRDPFSAHPFTIFRIGARYGGAPTSYDSTVRLKVKA